MAPSVLYQNFSQFIRQQWNNHVTLTPPSESSFNILIDNRKLDAKKELGNRARHIKNMNSLVDEISKIPKVTVRLQDFSLLNFPDQIKAVHSANIFISMHGAGTTHIFHMAVGRPNCCAVIELQPEGKFGYNKTFGFGNLARHLGIYHFRYVAADGSSSSDGSTVAIGDLKRNVLNAIDNIRERSSCKL